MRPDDLSFLSATALRKLIISKEVSPVEVTQQMLARIGKVTGPNQVYQAVFAEEAIRAAKEAELSVMRGDDDRPLVGIPVILTDTLRMKGRSSNYGSELSVGHVESEDSIEVSRIREAGAIILGKAVLPEFDLGDTLPTCCNPWDETCTAGASGAASAVARGLATMALGTDFWGSIRMSASFCGVVGCKPTRGSSPESSRKHVPYSQMHWGVRGTLTHTVEDCALALEVMAKYGIDLEEITHHEPQRIAVSRDFGFLPVDEEVQGHMDKAVKLFRELGHVVEEVNLPFNHDMLVHYRNVLAADLYAPIVSLSEKKESLGKKLASNTREWLAIGDEVTGVQYSLALSYSEWLRRSLDNLLQKYDLLVTPTESLCAYAKGEVEHVIGETRLDPLVGTWATTLPFNMSGHPALSVPIGWSNKKTPIGIQLAGRYFDEPRLFNLAHALQEVHQWDSWRPTIRDF